MKTWENIKNFDDIVIKEERKEIKDIEKNIKNKCPDLKKEGCFFYYCGKSLPEIADKIPSLQSPIYKRKLSLAELSLHCLSDYKSCCFYSSKLKR